MPKTELARIEAELELSELMDQSNISKKNIQRLETLVRSGVPHIAEMASYVLAVARVHPRKRRRAEFLARHHRDLLSQLNRLRFCGGDWYGPRVEWDDDQCLDGETEAEFHTYLSSGAGPEELCLSEAEAEFHALDSCE